MPTEKQRASLLEWEVVSRGAGGGSRMKTGSWQGLRGIIWGGHLPTVCMNDLDPTEFGV